MPCLLFGKSLFTSGVFSKLARYPIISRHLKHRICFCLLLSTFAFRLFLNLLSLNLYLLTFIFVLILLRLRLWFFKSRLQHSIGHLYFLRTFRHLDQIGIWPCLFENFDLNKSILLILFNIFLCIILFFKILDFQEANSRYFKHGVQGRNLAYIQLHVKYAYVYSQIVNIKLHATGLRLCIHEIYMYYIILVDFNSSFMEGTTV